MKKVLLIGTVPPPIGGVSIHLERFMFFSKKYEDKVKVKIYDIRKDKIKHLLLEIFFADIIHIHLSNNFKIFIALLSRVLGKKVIYTHHNSRVDNKFYFKLINLLSNTVVLVNDKEIDLDGLNITKIKHIPAFLPPYNFKELPTYMDKKISNSGFVISTNCFRYTLLNEKDLYGFDLIVKAYANLIIAEKLINPLLILVDPSATTQEYMDSLLSSYPMLDSRNILYVTEAIDFSTLIKKSNLTIRATRSDGDSLSVRESLYLGVPIIASDITYRPKNTILFENENISELEHKIYNVYKNKENLSVFEVENFADAVISLYGVI